MDTSLGKIMSHVYELEGLLLVIEKHAEDTPDFVLTMLRGKARELADEVQLYKLPEKEEPAPAPVQAQPQATQPVAETAAAPEEAPQEASPIEEDYDSDDTRQHDEGESLNEVFSSDYVEPEHRTATVAEAPETEEEAEADGDEDDKPNVVPPAMPKISLNDNGEELRVDEKLQRTLSKDLHKAFSLNDRYRFRRELFSNSELDWNDALNMVASMSSYEEAEDYFYNDLGWGKDSEEVADFMNVIKNHFS